MARRTRFGAQNKTARHSVHMHTGNGMGSTNTMIRRFTTTRHNIGNAITYVDSATAGASFTINRSGLYIISHTDLKTDAGFGLGVSRNSTELTTTIQNINEANRLFEVSAGTNTIAGGSIAVYLNAGDIIRAHGDGGANSTTPAFTMFSILYVPTV